ncbi:O-acyltransferase like protein [Trachemys scripta elegans]|uniref:O-acyltransferase like protein n=1 Tax=Trachemys scripta elegans TaxID=31138 RepID=UPI0015570E06|nr:O-acyltransferase like protein [Trachemys scripta elegans]
MSVSLLMLLLMPLIRYASPVRNVSLRCLEDTNQFLSDLNAVEPKAYAIMMYDSLGKLGSNILGGNTDRLGSYTECLSAKVPSGKFQGQYCKLQVQQEGFDYSIGICVPDSCHDEDITTLAILDIFKFKTISFVSPFPSLFTLNSTVSVVSVARCAKGLFSIDAFAAICLFVSIVFIVLPITGTVYAAAVRWEVKFDESPSDSLPSANYGSTSSNEKDKRESKGDIRRNHYKMNSVLPVVSDDVCYTKKTFLGALDSTLKCFSLQKNLPTIWTVKSSKGVCSALNGIRVLSLVWIISGHTSQMAAWQNLDNVLEWKERVLKNPIYVYSRSGPFYLGVDTFFLISGWLSSRSLLNIVHHSEKGITLEVTLKYLCNRLARLQPLHMYSICLLVGLYSVIPWGSIWEISKFHLDNCRRVWWSNLFLLNNFISVTESCNGWTWYLANDFQFYLTTPLVVFLYARSKCGLIIVGTTLFLASFTVTALLSSFFRLPVASPSDTREMSTVMYFTEYYTKPYCRYGPFLVGVLLELFMYHQQAQILRNKVQASLGWLCAMLAMLAVVSLAYAIEDSVNSYSPAAVIYQALHRTLWAAAIGWIIFACQEGYGGLANWVLSWDIWTLLAKISYACYLVHPMLIILYNGLQETLMHYSDINMLYLFFGHCLMTFITGLALTVLVEKPFEGLKQSLTCQFHRKALL